MNKTQTPLTMKYSCLFLISLVAACGTTKEPSGPGEFNEPHRPQVHFSPKAKWMNDPNGLVFYNNTYHLFYQHYPDSTVWGPMHWGHATSADLIHWEHQPIALYPDSLGYIFSGSAVADVNNTSGFGKDGKIPLVAIFTHHNAELEKENRTDYQYQSIAYSLDEGQTWTKYSGNPVLKNPGIKDFRDPKVMWYEEGKKWIMTLATLDRITFYSSSDLKSWTKESEFGKEYGAHGGVWECPDLFTLELNGQKVWILLVSINPGGPNKGSATQYFTGQFDGHEFKPYQTDTRWIDYGPDNYAGITWFNTGDRKIFIGWMSNWLYANIVPTEAWRNAMTIPRDLGLKKEGERFLVTSLPSPELSKIAAPISELSNVDVQSLNLSSQVGELDGAARLRLKSTQLKPFRIILSNDKGEKLTIGYDKANNNYYIDRRASGKTSFGNEFAGIHTAPRLTSEQAFNLDLVIDVSSVELFADNGLSVMTQTFFPNSSFTAIRIESDEPFNLESLKYEKLSRIWK